MAAMQRLFAGIELSDEAMEDVARLKAPLPGARWIEPDNLHITLRFAGDIESRVAADFSSALTEIRVEAFSLRLKGLGTYGGATPSTLWAGVEASSQLGALQRATERAARRAGLSPETRAFKPHVTIARLGRSRDVALARFLERNAHFASEPFFVGRFVLFSSRPRVGGGPYVVEEVYPLSGGLGDYGHLDDGW